MYEDILGRPASPPEKKMMDHGFSPDLKVGDTVRVIRQNGMNKAVEGKIDAIVLFAVPLLPGAPGPQLSWGFRIEGMDEYLPQKVLHKI